MHFNLHRYQLQRTSKQGPKLDERHRPHMQQLSTPQAATARIAIPPCKICMTLEDAMGKYKRCHCGSNLMKKKLTHATNGFE